MSLKVRDVMSPAPIAVPKTATLVEAAQRMRVADVGDVLVLDDDRACGLITDRDIVVRAIAMNYRPDKTTVDEICSHDLVSVPSDSDIDVANALMRERSVRRIPVIDNGVAVGVVSLGDLAIAKDPGSTLADISAAPPNT